MKLIVKLIVKLTSRLRFKPRNWKEIERFNESWRPRIKQMASNISREDTVIVDLGCGPMWLQSELPKSAHRYIGVDYKDRGAGSIICDFNLGQFPDVYADVFFVSGCMEYVKNWTWFVEKIASSGKKCILSYCCIDDVSDPNLRKNNAWISSASSREIVRKFSECNMALIKSERFDANNSIFVFERRFITAKVSTTPPPKYAP